MQLTCLIPRLVKEGDHSDSPTGNALNCFKEGENTLERAGPRDAAVLRHASAHWSFLLFLLACITASSESIDYYQVLLVLLAFIVRRQHKEHVLLPACHPFWKNDFYKVL
jgi:hypothetical protein